ncbi:DUF1997 domain-containing protein [Cyanobium sp. NS01]|uniref:DUF1997 domain-containing protein n=1 Tax=Cyanobium sp. NS01 TaxID=261284 RepID=UPI00164743A7|nr:DUF1997 domain-containing protein [Cyanobium sp. NS01]QNI69781.1 conserved hypothetical protein (DUF1997) [Cyanobium sp. NS01]
MSRELLRLSESRHCLVDLFGAAPLAQQRPQVSDALLRAYLRHPGRVLAALLSRQRLKRLAAGRFHYSSRAIVAGPWQLQPQFWFNASWSGDSVQIQLVDCQLQGLPDSGPGQGVRLELEACLRAENAMLVASATAALELQPGPLTGWLPRPLFALLGRQALLACLSRLESRCQRRLPLNALAWMDRGELAAQGIAAPAHQEPF